MLVVAITRWGPPLEQELAALAPLLGLGLYDAKMRLAGPTPVVFARLEQQESARELLVTLRERGHGAVACDLAFVPSSGSMAAPRGYELGETEFVALDPSWGRRVLAYDEILALIRAGASASEQTSSVTKEKKFSMGRAALSGGIVRSKTTTTTNRSTTEQREQVLYVIRNTGRDPFLLRESHVRHEGLGDQRKATKLLNFVAMVDALRARAPTALYDDRLLKQRRKGSLSSVAGGESNRVAISSNASENDLAAHLVAIAHLKRQL